jgi:hypothetical protein
MGHSAALAPAAAWPQAAGRARRRRRHRGGGGGRVECGGLLELREQRVALEAQPVDQGVRPGPGLGAGLAGSRGAAALAGGVVGLAALRVHDDRLRQRALQALPGPQRPSRGGFSTPSKLAKKAATLIET